MQKVIHHLCRQKDKTVLGLKHASHMTENLQQKKAGVQSEISANYQKLVLMRTMYYFDTINHYFTLII